MQESKLRVAVFSAGAWANFAHIPGWQRDPRCDVVAICDPVADRAREFAAKFNYFGETTAKLSKADQAK
jgi:predicted dehydrogenase